MHNNSKKFLAILLTLCMLLSAMPLGVFAAGNTAEVVGQQLMLGDDLTMHFYVTVADSTNAVATIQVGGNQRVSYTLAQMTAGENGYDLAVDLAAAEMTEDILLTVSDSAETLLTKTYSVQDYAQALLDGNYTDETKALVKEMLNYGTKAQLYFGHKTDDLANAGNEIDTQATIPEEAAEITVSGSADGISYYGSSMVFRSKIAVRHYFKVSGDVSGYSFTVDGSGYDPVFKNDMYYIEVADINPQEMDTAMAVSVSDGSNALSFAYSPMNYITRMYHKDTTSTELKTLLVAVNGYFEAAAVFTGVAENRTGSLNLAYRYGTNNLIQVNTNLPSDTPCANFTVGDNGCSIDQSANQYQQVGWIGMDNVDGTIVLTFHFNAAFEAGQNYTLPVGAVFGFTDNSKYTLDADYTFTWDGASWTMTAVAPEPEPEPTEPEEDSLNFAYRYGTSTLIQVNTNLPASTPIANFTADQNGCSIDQSGNTVQWVGWIGMANADGTIVLTFNFNSAFEAGQSYVLPAGAIFGFTDGNTYTLDADYTFTWDGSNWSMTAVTPEPEPEPTEPEPTEPEEEGWVFQYRYGTSNLIQVNTALPSTTPCVNFLTGDNGCSIDESANLYQQTAWIGMENVDGTIVLTFHFNAEFTEGQTYFLPAGAVFGFTDGNTYTLTADHTFTWDGANWSLTTQVPVPEPEQTTVSFQYRYGAANLIQFNTNLPATTAIKDFLATDNGCQINQSGDQQVGYISMVNADGTIVLTFNFNSAFTAGQSYTLAAGSVFAFTDGTSYILDADYTYYWDGANWTTEEPQQEMGLSYRYGAANLIQFNTDLPATTAIKDFLASDNGCQINQSGDQQVGYISMLNDNGTIVLTFNFNSAFTAGQSYTLAAGSVFAFTDGTSYILDTDYTFYWNGTAWGVDPIMTLSYRYGAANLIQFNTNLPATTALKDFLASDNGCQINQSGDQQVGYISMVNADGTIVLTFNFNAAFTYGQSYTLAAGSVFAFTDGSAYKLDRAYTFYWNDTAWSETEPAPQADVLDESNFTGGKDFTSFADLPVDSNDPEKIEEYKGLGFNTSLLAEDHTSAQGPDERYAVTMETANAPEGSLGFAYRYGTSTLIQVNTNLPASTPIANFTADQNGCSIDQSGNAVQWVGWIGMANADGTIVLTFNFNSAFEAGQSYVLPKGAVFGFTDGNTYVLDADYTFTFDGTNWSMNASTLSFSLSAGAAKYIQLKSNIPTGLTYGDFLLGDASKGHNVILETTDGAQAVGWFSYSELNGAVYLTFNFNGYNKPGTQYILKAGTSLKAGDFVYTTDRDYILTVHNDYLQSLENLDDAGLNVWIRNYHNTPDYFSDNLTATLLLYKDVIDGFYMTDEAFQTNALLTAAGQEAHSTDFESMTVLRDWFNTNFADKYFHVNHVPISSYDHYTDVNGNTLDAMDAEGYRAFLQAYKAAFNDQLASASGASIGFDNYPFVHAQGTYRYGTLNLQSKFESGIQSTYLLNCLIAAQVAAEDDFGLCIQTFEAADLTYDVKRDIVSSAEVSLQLYTGMAMGADVFEYFAYNSNGDFNAIMNQDGSKRIYDIVKEGNEALCFADVINTFTWNGIVTSTGSTNSDNTEGFDYVANMVLTNASNGALDSYSSTDDAVIGCFTKDSLNGYMVVNFNDPAAVTGNNTVSLTFANCTRARIYTCVDGVLTSQLVELSDGACTVTLAPGSGCFVIPA